MQLKSNNRQIHFKKIPQSNLNRNFLSCLKTTDSYFINTNSSVYIPIDFDQTSRKILKSHDSNKSNYCKKKINLLLTNSKSHLVAKFKDFLIFDDPGEFLKRYYSMEESLQRFSCIFKFYSVNTPNASILNSQRKVLSKNSILKKRSCLRVTVNTESHSTIILNTEAKESIMNEDFSCREQFNGENFLNDMVELITYIDNLERNPQIKNIDRNGKLMYVNKISPNKKSRQSDREKQKFKNENWNVSRDCSHNKNRNSINIEIENPIISHGDQQKNIRSKFQPAKTSTNADRKKHTNLNLQMIKPTIHLEIDFSRDSYNNHHNTNQLNYGDFTEYERNECQAKASNNKTNLTNRIINKNNKNGSYDKTDAKVKILNRDLFSEKWLNQGNGLHDALTNRIIRTRNKENPNSKIKCNSVYTRKNPNEDTAFSNSQVSLNIRLRKKRVFSTSMSKDARKEKKNTNGMQ